MREAKLVTLRDYAVQMQRSFREGAEKGPGAPSPAGDPNSS